MLILFCFFLTKAQRHWNKFDHFFKGSALIKKQGNKSHGEFKKKKSLKEGNFYLLKFLCECVISPFTEAHHLEERISLL